MEEATAISKGSLPTYFIPAIISRAGITKALSFLSLKLYAPTFYSSEKIMNAVCPIPNPKANYPKLEATHRVVVAILFVPALILSLPFAAVAGLIEVAETKISPTPYIVFKGNAPSKAASTEQVTAYTQNICCFGGGLPQVWGGVAPAHKRIDALCRPIIESNPDIVLLQEVSSGPARALMSKLGGMYSTFFTTIGRNPFRMDSDLFVATRLPIEGEPRFIAFPNHTFFRRGAFCFETKEHRIYTSHFCPGSEGKAVKQRQLELQIIKKDTQDYPTKKIIIVGGDLNLAVTPASSAEYEELNIKQDFLDPYQEKHQPINLDPDSATYVDVAKVRKNSGIVHKDHLELNDYFYIFRGAEQEHSFETTLLKGAFALEKRPPTDIYYLDEHGGLDTDHRALLLTIRNKV